MIAAGTPSHVGAGSVGAGSVQIDSSAKPLVPYPMGISGQGPARQPSRSRLANTASAEEGMQQCFRLTHSHCPQLGFHSHAPPLAPVHHQGCCLTKLWCASGWSCCSKLCCSLLAILPELLLCSLRPEVISSSQCLGAQHPTLQLYCRFV